MKEYLKVNDFAKVAGVSAQSVYKRIKKKSNPIQPFLKEIDNQLFINKSALSILYGIEVKETTTQPSVIVDKPTTEEKENIKVTTEDVKEIKENEKVNKEAEALQEVIHILSTQLEVQKKSNEEKDYIIKELNNRLAESNRMLDQQQKLSMADKKRILELEEGREEKKKKGIINWLKGLTSN